MTRPPYAFLSVAVLAAAAVVAGHATDPKPRAEGVITTQVRPVEGAVAVCPELLRQGSDVVTRLTAGTSGTDPVSVRAAKLVPGSGLGEVVLKTPRHVGILPLRADQAVAAVVTAAGTGAGGLEVEQTSRGADGPHRGWAGVRCEPPVGDAWFLGAVTAADSESQLVLVNPYDDGALASVELYDRKGRIDVPELDGVTLPARTRLVRELVNYAPDEGVLAVHVVTREGRVASAVRVSRAHGSTPLGVDWIPRTGQPSDQVDIAGMPQGNGRRLLHVLAPGEDDAHLRIQVTLSDEQYVPDGYDDITVRAGRLATVDLTKLLQVINQKTAEKTERPASLRIYAEGGPVLATAFVESVARFLPIREFAFVGPARPLSGPALVSDARSGQPYDCLLLLSAPDGNAQVEIATVVPEGEVRRVARVTVEVPAGRVVGFQLNTLARSALQPVIVTPQPGSATVYGTRLLTEQGQRGPLFTVQTLVTQPSAGVAVPVVRRDLGAAFPQRLADGS